MHDKDHNIHIYKKQHINYMTRDKNKSCHHTTLHNNADISY